MTEIQMKQAFELHQAGKLKDAEAVYLDVVADDPQNADALKFLGILACQQGNLDEGVSYLEAAVENEPDTAEYHLALGRALFEVDKKSEGVASVEKAKDLDPADAEIFATLGYFYQHLRNFPEALRAYQRAAVIVPENLRFTVGAGLCAFFSGQKDIAREYFDKALVGDKSIHQAHYGMAMIAADENDMGAANDFLSEALKLDSDNPEYLRIQAEFAKL